MTGRDETKHENLIVYMIVILAISKPFLDGMVFLIIHINQYIIPQIIIIVSVYTHSLV
jgi:hypothetical protein